MTPSLMNTDTGINLPRVSGATATGIPLCGGWKLGMIVRMQSTGRPAEGRSRGARGMTPGSESSQPPQRSRQVVMFDRRYRVAPRLDLYNGPNGPQMTTTNYRR